MPQIAGAVSVKIPTIQPYTHRHPDQIRNENLQRFFATLEPKQKVLMTDNLCQSLGYSNPQRLLRRIRDRKLGTVDNNYVIKI